MRKKLTLSAAMRSGMNFLTDVPQIDGKLCRVEFGDNGNELTGCCAEGFAYIGACGELGLDYVLKNTHRSLYPKLRRMFPELRNKLVEFEGDKMYVENVIWRMNDNKHWSITKIASELEKLGF